MIIQPGIAKAELGVFREDVTLEDHVRTPLISHLLLIVDISVGGLGSPHRVFVLGKIGGGSRVGDIRPLELFVRIIKLGYK